MCVLETSVPAAFACRPHSSNESNPYFAESENLIIEFISSELLQVSRLVLQSVFTSPRLNYEKYFLVASQDQVGSQTHGRHSPCIPSSPVSHGGRLSGTCLKHSTVDPPEDSLGQLKTE